MNYVYTQFYAQGNVICSLPGPVLTSLYEGFYGDPGFSSTPHSPPYSDEKVANRDIRVWHGATENGPRMMDKSQTPRHDCRSCPKLVPRGFGLSIIKEPFYIHQIPYILYHDSQLFHRCTAVRHEFFFPNQGS
jgi:hypothetical protein